MILCEEIETIFIAIPKTGTRSVYEVLINNFGGRMIGEHKMKVPDRYASYYTFIITRNPYDRLVSAWWSTTQRGHDRYSYRKQLGGDISFLNYCKNLHRYGGKPMPHSALQSRWFDNKIDKVIRYENLNKEWLELPFNKSRIPLPHKNPTVIPTEKQPVPRKSYTEYLNNEIIQMINDYYHEDFINLDYEKIII